MILESDIQAIANETRTEMLALWWCQLNLFKWPREIPDPETDADKPGDRRDVIMTTIETKIGIKECLRVWNAERMSKDEFEKWWARRPVLPNGEPLRFRARIKESM